MTEHHWSGWPGAFCLDCGADDQNEICVAEHASVALTCVEGHEGCEQRHKWKTCLEHKQTECPKTKPNPNCGQCLADTVEAVVNQQVWDEGLWFIAKTAPEAYLQRALRRLHRAIEEQDRQSK